MNSTNIINTMLWICIILLAIGIFSGFFKAIAANVKKDLRRRNQIFREMFVPSVIMLILTLIKLFV